MDEVAVALEAQAREIPACEGVYRLYQGTRLLHIGMAAGAATLRSELLGHAHGDYGAATQHADRIDWQVAPDAAFAYECLAALFAEATYTASGSDEESAVLSMSLRHSSPATAS